MGDASRTYRLLIPGLSHFRERQIVSGRKSNTTHRLPSLAASRPSQFFLHFLLFFLCLYSCHPLLLSTYSYPSVASRVTHCQSSALLAWPSPHIFELIPRAEPEPVNRIDRQRPLFGSLGLLSACTADKQPPDLASAPLPSPRPKLPNRDHPPRRAKTL